ncbi:hypothetical protein ACWEGE_39120 [Amycolatopsis sp. NPDC004747]
MTVHQIRYGWASSTLLGSRGMGPVESTLPESGLSDWDPYLRDHVWAVGPDAGFTFVQLGDVGALVRKVPAAAEDGRPGSAAHVLLCRDLSPRTALGLASWGGWDTLEHGVLSWSALETSAHHGIRNLRARARRLPPDRLASLFGQLLGAPGDCYTVIGESDPLAVTCALGDLIGRPPTFASDEPDDNGRHLPTAVFLRHAPVSTTAASRRRLVASATPDETDVAAFASAVVGAYVTDGVDVVNRIQRSQPPATVDEVRDWAAGAQFAPGVLADITWLPRLHPEVLAGLARPEATELLRAAAGSAPMTTLVTTLQQNLPHEVMKVIVDEALRKAFAAADRSEVRRLAALGPFPLELVSPHVPPNLDAVTYLAGDLLTARDKQVLIHQAAGSLVYPEVLRWIDERSETDGENARYVYDSLCRSLYERKRKVTLEDMRALVARGALEEAVRRFAGSEQQISGYLVEHLAVLPKRVLTRDVVADLADRAGPVLLHALDTVLVDPAGREVVHHRIRLGYYQAHHLPAPTADPGRPQGNGALRWLFRRRPSNPRKLM